MQINVTIVGQILDDQIANFANKSIAVFDKYHIDIRNHGIFKRGPSLYFRFAKTENSFIQTSNPLLQIEGLTCGDSHWSLSKLDSLKEDLEKALEIEVSMN